MRTPFFNLHRPSATALAALTVATLAFSACGNNYRKTAASSSASVNGDAVSISNGSTTSSSNYSCPGIPNITSSNPDLSTTDEFTACTSSNAASILIHGSTQISNVICGFPAQISTGSSAPVVLTDSETNQPLVTCVDTSSATNGIVMNFTVSNFNAIFIVEGPYEAQMAQCLMDEGTSENYYGCPTFSYGLFR